MSRYLWPITALICAVVVAVGAIVIARELHNRSTSSASSSTSGQVSTPPAGSSGAPPGGSSSAPSAPALPPTAFTVCTYPVGTCNGQMRTQPTQVLTSGDGSAYVRGITWSGWGSPTATGTGTMEIDDCNPNCAQGTFTGYPATITLSGLTPYASGKQAYADMTITTSAAAGGTRSYHHLLP
jgi:hypothetical protein